MAMANSKIMVRCTRHRGRRSRSTDSGGSRSEMARRRDRERRCFSQRARSRSNTACSAHSCRPILRDTTNTSSSAAGSVQAACPCDRCSGVRDRAEAVHDERTRHGGSFLLPEYIDSCCWRHRRTICVSAFVCASARIGSSPPSRDNPDRFIIVTFPRACNYGMRGVIPHLAS